MIMANFESPEDGSLGKNKDGGTPTATEGRRAKDYQKIYKKRKNISMGGGAGNCPILEQKVGGHSHGR